MRRRRGLDWGRSHRGRHEGPGVFYVAPVGDAAGAGSLPVVDLLHREPKAWPDLSGSVELVRFAFEGGDCAGAFDELTRALPLGPKRRGFESIAAQLHLPQLVESSLFPTIDGVRAKHDAGVLRAVLDASAGAADVRVRHEVLHELASDGPARGQLEQLRVGLAALREALETSPATEPNIVRRKVQVLVALQRVVATLRDGFEGSTSALARLRELGQAIAARPLWARLVELVDLEGNVAVVDVRLKLGSDGTVRAFGVLSVRERSDAGLVPGPLGRFFQQVLAFLRGHHYSENDVVVRLLEEVFAPFAEDVVALLAISAAVDVYLAALTFRDQATRRGLAVCLPELVHAPSLDGPAETRILEGVFNPLLFLQDVTPIPCSLPADPHDALIVLTGPNSGGKTRLLQSIGLVQVLGEAGLFVPASKARLIRAPQLFLSLVADGDAGQVEGRLGTELMRVRNLFEHLEPGALAILDELCSGTNPNEGEAIFEWVVELLPRLRPQVVVSTHFLGLAARLEAKGDPTLAFLQVELDADENATFQFVRGVATTSLAHRVAARLGVTREALDGLVEAKRRAIQRA